MDLQNIVSVGGIVVLLFVAWAFSSNRRNINLRVVCWGVGLQLLLALLVFRMPGSTHVFEWFDTFFNSILHAAGAGQRFLFGPLADREQTGFVLALQAFPVIIFFAALMALLYYWRIMPWIIRGFAWVFTTVMRISGAESLCAATNIFVGVESATAVRPYLQRMTRSELCTILTAGMATVASSTLGIYVFMLKDTFPGIAGHLFSASILSAPAAIVMSKLLVPEDEQPLTLGVHVTFDPPRESGAIEAILSGASAGVRLVVGICALLIAFLGMIALVNLLLHWATAGANGGLESLGADPVLPELSLQWMLKYLLWPLTVVMGVPVSDALAVSEMLGRRLIETEIPAYVQLAESMKLPAGSPGALADPRSAVIAAYALCGFAHVGSMAIFVGGISALVPDRRSDIARLGPRALLAATLACLMTGAVAGVFFSETTANLLATAATAPAPQRTTTPNSPPIEKAPEPPSTSPRTI